MKKIKRYDTINKQEDEDGYSLQHSNAIISDNAKRKKESSSHNNSASIKIHPANFAFSLPGLRRFISKFYSPAFDANDQDYQKINGINTATGCAGETSNNS